ncbi:YncE family protein [Rhodococcus tukisamuensis]|uniref:40-residue YVTN family beta-propeller repeat-containing protein n=1 Tax=Rhodococcus tukisamuensis TaxID=168276 RepID=A0A1G7E2T4_9NOCA|nr:YncE family protein [Rhodococcus tukisamuensis]SDE58033.1 40-residue YVTN family beta-propeller repeat-containing protein [Rhodococcus tukisamuensis]
MIEASSRMTRGRRKGWATAATVTAVAATFVVGTGAGPAVAQPAAGLAEVLFVGNNWDGTADVIESTGNYAKVGRVNIIPDKQERLGEIYLDPVKLAFFLGVRLTAGEGHDQFVDDMYTTPDGSAVVASRPSFADVVSIDLASGKINWRFPVSGFRADHMAVSPDGSRVAVSASTSNTVHVLDIRTGAQVGSFKTGDKPHENVFTDGGRYLWNMSIGEVNTGTDDPSQDSTKGDRRITVVDAQTFQTVRVIDMRDRLDAFGRQDLSDSVRPVAFSPDESKLYFQVSFFNGFVEYDVATDKITRVKELPKNPDTNPDRTTWVNDSRHHGMSISPDGGKLCIAGTMDDYVTIVDTVTLQESPTVPAAKPYWATVNGDGTHCVISESASDSVSAIDFATGQKVATVAVGDHPQRVRIGHVPAGWAGTPDVGGTGSLGAGSLDTGSLDTGSAGS